MTRQRSVVPSFGLACSALALAGCASTALAPVRVRAFSGTSWPPLAPGQALIVDFKAGDRIPVNVHVDGEIVETEPLQSVFYLRAKRDFSVRIRGAEIKTSLDGRDFEAKPSVPGRFQLGLVATRDGEPMVIVNVTTPVHAKP